jgi:hypothetical protein
MGNALLVIDAAHRGLHLIRCASWPEPACAGRRGFGQPATPPVPFFASYILTTDFQDAEDHRMPININGSFIDLPRDTRVSLLDLLRDHLDLAGTKKGCNQGACLKTQR